MEINEKRVAEIFLATILVLLLIILIFLFTSQSATGKSTSTSTSTTNSYNTDSYNTYYVSSYPPTQRYYGSYRYPPEYYIKDDRNHLVYNSRSDRTKVERLLGGYIDKYVVYVRNNDYNGGYFTVKFYLTDYYGKTFTESMTKYIKPNEEKSFFYKNIYAERYKYYDWSYEVISRTKVPKRDYIESPRITYTEEPMRIRYVGR